MKEVIVTIRSQDLDILKKRCSMTCDEIVIDANNKIILLENIIKIERRDEDYRSEILLSAEKSFAKIECLGQKILIDIDVKQLRIDKERILAQYDTGEMIELQIDFI